MRTAKIQISLRIRAVWSETSLDSFRIANHHEKNAYIILTPLNPTFI